MLVCDAFELSPLMSDETYCVCVYVCVCVCVCVSVCLSVSVCVSSSLFLCLYLARGLRSL